MKTNKTKKKQPSLTCAFRMPIGSPPSVVGNSHRAFLVIAAVLVVIVLAAAAWKHAQLGRGSEPPRTVVASGTPLDVVERLVLHDAEPAATPEVEPPKPWTMSVTVMLGDELGLPTDRAIPDGAIAEFHVLGKMIEEEFDPTDFFPQRDRIVLATKQAKIGEETTFEVPYRPMRLLVGAQAAGLFVTHAGIPIVPPEPKSGIWSANVRRRVPSESDDEDESPALIQVVGPRLSFDPPTPEQLTDRMMATVETKESDVDARHLKLHVILGTLSLGHLRVSAHPLNDAMGSKDRLAGARLYPLSNDLLLGKSARPIRMLSPQRARHLVARIEPIFDQEAGTATLEGIPPGIYEVAVMMESGRHGYTEAIQVLPGATIEAQALLGEGTWPSLSVQVVESDNDLAGVAGVDVEFDRQRLGFPAADPGDGLGGGEVGISKDKTWRREEHEWWRLKRTTDSQGRIHIPRFPMGVTKVRLQAKGIDMQAEIELDSEGDNSFQFVLDNWESMYKINVVNETGIPATGATLVLTKIDDRSDRPERRYPLKEGVLDIKLPGNYWRIDVENLPPGLSYHPAYARPGATMDDDNEVRLAKSIPIIVTVLEQGKPKVGASVGLGEYGPRDVIETDARGEAHFVQTEDAEDMVHLILPEQRDFPILSEPLKPKAGEDGIHRLTLEWPQELRAIEGFVCSSSENKAPVPKAMVSLMDEELPLRVSRVMADVDGKWEIIFPPGTYLFQVEAPGYVAWRKNLEIPGGAAEAFQLETPMVRGSATLMVELVEDRGNPLAGLRAYGFVNQDNGEWNAPWANSSDHRGRLVLEGLPAGTWEGRISQDFSITRQDWSGQLKPTEVKEGETKLVRVVCRTRDRSSRHRDGVKPFIKKL